MENIQVNEDPLVYDSAEDMKSVVVARLLHSEVSEVQEIIHINGSNGLRNLADILVLMVLIILRAFRRRQS